MCQEHDRYRITPRGTGCGRKPSDDGRVGRFWTSRHCAAPFLGFFFANARFWVDKEAIVKSFGGGWVASVGGVSKQRRATLLKGPSDDVGVVFGAFVCEVLHAQYLLHFER